MEICFIAQALLPAKLRELGIVHEKTRANAFLLIAAFIGALRQCIGIIISREAALNMLLTFVSVLGKLTDSRQPGLLTAALL